MKHKRLPKKLATTTSSPTQRTGEAKRFGEISAHTPVSRIKGIRVVGAGGMGMGYGGKEGRKEGRMGCSFLLFEMGKGSIAGMGTVPECTWIISCTFLFWMA